MFENGAAWLRLHRGDERPRWAFCAERLECDAPALIAICAGLLLRARARGHFAFPTGLGYRIATSTA